MNRSLAALALSAACMLPQAAWAADPFTAFMPSSSGTLSAFRFEAGARYWYSKGEVKFGFANGDPLFGNPTSTIDWNDTTSHSGELFARLDHRPTGLFVKGLIGGGNIKDGEMIDRDFLTGQVSFSDTYSTINDGSLKYGVIDAGMSFDVPSAPMRIGIFGGYHYWTSSMTAFGVRCNPDNLGNLLCNPAGATVIPFDTAVMVYEPTWHAARLGLDGKMMITSSLSVSGEFAWMPWASLANDDSHLLRQSMTDLGPAPNIIATSTKGNGFSAEAFLNWHVTKNLEIGAGLRYWEFSIHSGNVRPGPAFTQDFPLTKFIEHRYGALLQIKGKI
jgi:hypothetical protein